MPELWVIALICLAFFAAGFVDSIAGGGGLISMPSFLLAGVAPEFVLGTSKLATTFGTGLALVNYARSGLVIWRMALGGIPASLAGAALGSEAILLFDSASIGKIMLVLLPLGALVTLLPKKGSLKNREPGELNKRQLYIYTPLICMVLGFYDGFFGPGTGSFFIIAFSCFLQLGLVQASATTKLLNLATNISSMTIFALNGSILYLLALPLAAANMAGNLLGSRLAIKIGAAFVRKVLYVSLSLLFLSLLYKFLA